MISLKSLIIEMRSPRKGDLVKMKGDVGKVAHAAGGVVYVNWDWSAEIGLGPEVPLKKLKWNGKVWLGETLKRESNDDMIKLRDLIMEQEWMSGPPPGKSGGHEIFGAVDRLDKRLTRERERRIAAIDRELNATVKKELRGYKKEYVKIVDARWNSIAGKPAIEVKLSGEGF